jgi:hypothetical protein
MRTPYIIALVLILGLSIAFGVYIGPSLHRVPASVAASSNQSTSLAAPTSGATASSADAAMISPTADSLDSILNDPDPTDRANKLQAYVQAIPADKFAVTAIDLCGKLPMDEVQAVLPPLVVRWVQTDPNGARAAIATIPDPRVQYLLAQYVFADLAASDPATALQQAGQLPTLALRDIADAAVVQEVAKHDPATALKLYNEANLSGPALGSIFMEWADRDLSQATQALVSLPHGDDRTNVVRFIAHRLLEKDPAAAIAWLDGLPPGLGDPMSRQMIMGRWGQVDPKAASEYISQVRDALPPENLRQLDFALSISWAQKDPKSAAAWAFTLPKQERADAVQVAMSSWARTDPKSAAAFLISAGLDDSTEGSAAAGLVTEWMKSDPQAAMNWVNGLPPDSSAHTFATNAATQGMVKQSPAKAASYVAVMPDGPNKWNAIGQIAGQWSKDDPAAAAQWVANLPDCPPKQFSLQMIAGQWATSDPEKASAWLMQLPGGANRDEAVQAFSSAVFHTDPNAALQWAQSISDSDAHQTQVESILRHWMASDPDKAQIAIKNSSLTDDEKNDLLQNQ